jgi:hypothetical protein
VEAQVRFSHQPPSARCIALVDQPDHEEARGVLKPLALYESAGTGEHPLTLWQPFVVKPKWSRGGVKG